MKEKEKESETEGGIVESFYLLFANVGPKLATTLSFCIGEVGILSYPILFFYLFTTNFTYFNILIRSFLTLFILPFGFLPFSIRLLYFI